MMIELLDGLRPVHRLLSSSKQNGKIEIYFTCLRCENSYFCAPASGGKSLFDTFGMQDVICNLRTRCYLTRLIAALTCILLDFRHILGV